MTTPRRFLPLIALLAGAALLGAGGGVVGFALLGDDAGPVVRNVTVSGTRTAAATGTLSVNSVYEAANHGVVEITTTTSTAAAPFGDSQSQALGSGFVFDTSGHIVTNQHVVDGAGTISVRFWNGATYAAKVVGTDPSTDLAVIRVEAPTTLLSPLALGDSGAAEIGDGVVAIGSPFGLEGTVTFGIVSALHRQMTAPNNFSINDTIQTDAAINHGNSGGPLLDLQAKVIGVNAQIKSDSGGNEGVGFAIPSNTVSAIAEQLIATGSVEHAYLGVSLETIPASVASELGVPAGVAVAEVRPGTPAARAGLKAATGSSAVAGQQYPTGGDVITAVDGKAVTSAAEMQSAIDAHRPGDDVSVTYVRGGKSHTVTITLGTRPA